jgi:hypothetical protein
MTKGPKQTEVGQAKLSNVTSARPLRLLLTLLPSRKAVDHRALQLTCPNGGPWAHLVTHCWQPASPPRQHCNKLARPHRVPHIRSGLPAGHGLRRRAWRIPCDNRYKDTLWFLAVKGVPGAGGHDIVHRSACLCVWLPPTLPSPQATMQLRHLAFLDCPVAFAVHWQLNQALFPGRPCSELKLWLVQTPTGAQQPVWERESSLQATTNQV